MEGIFRRIFSKLYEAKEEICLFISYVYQMYVIESKPTEYGNNRFIENTNKKARFTTSIYQIKMSKTNIFGVNKMYT